MPSDITEDEMKRFWALNPTGDYLDTKTIISIHIESKGNGLGLVNGMPITAKLIHESYEAYLGYWKQLYGRKDPKYISKDNQLKTIGRFVTDMDYQRAFNSFQTSRDSYLFKNFTNEQIKAFGLTEV